MVTKAEVLDKGSVELLAHCASDLDVANAARVSFNTESTEFTEREEGLVKFLMRERHGTPFEHGYFRFRVKAPLFVFREWHRHRVGHSYNEWSARYSKMEPDFYIPDVGDVVTQTGKPGAYTFEPMDMAIGASLPLALSLHADESFRLYEEAMLHGVARQQARMFLPVNLYSVMIWSCNPRSLLHFCSLRNSEHAQWEIRQYAIAVEDMFATIMPCTHEAFVENERRAP